MNNKTIKFISLITFVLFWGAGAAWAQGGGRNLSKHEQQFLKHERNHLRQAERFAAADGRISHREKRMLGNIHHRLARDRRHFMHNDGRRYDCRRGCRYHHEHRWPGYYRYTAYPPYEYYYSRPDHYRFLGTWLQPGVFFSLSLSGS